MKAYVWVVENCLINSQDAVNIIESIGPANQFMDKVKEFFEHPGKRLMSPIRMTSEFSIATSGAGAS